MDDAKLKKILQNQDVPSPDPNAKKRALNLAVAEFKTFQQEKQKTSQGISLLSRLMGRSTQKDRRNPMEQKANRRLIYGGTATAMAVLLIAGVSVVQLQTFEVNKNTSETTKTSTLKDAQFNLVEHEVTAPPATEEISVADVELPKEKEDSLQRHEAVAPPTPVLPLQAPLKPPVELLEDKKGEAMAQAMSKTVASREDITKGWAGGRTAAVPPMATADASIAPYPYPEPSPYYQDQGRDKFEEFKVNPVHIAAQEPVSTFSVDVDTASYSFARRMINSGSLPNPDSIRIEEMINYFDYNWPAPETKAEPFKATVSVTDNPWAQGKKLITVGIKGYEIGTEHPRSNLVFLIDVSGSMDEPTKLPLVKSSLKMLLDQMRPDDTVAIAVYAGAAGQVLAPTKISDKQTIINAIDSLTPGGSTAGAQGIALAYQLSEQTFDKNAVNRVILATDGDFNVGVSDPEELKKFVEQKRKTGVFLSVLGFGQGNLNDELMQKLAQNGNGAAAYIDTLNEARKVLVEEASSTLFPIAKDVKIQVEFNPATVAEYRLVGYETRHLNREDFNNDAVDAGDIGAGHTVTAIYEITPVGGPTSVDPLRYTTAAKPAVQVEAATADANFGGEYAFLKIRYKLPDENISKLITTPITDVKTEMAAPAQQDIDFSTAVAAFGQKLKGETYTANFSYDDIIALAQKGKGEDAFGYRAEFINMVRLAKSLGPAAGTIIAPVAPPINASQPVPRPYK